MKRLSSWQRWHSGFSGVLNGFQFVALTDFEATDNTMAWSMFMFVIGLVLTICSVVLSLIYLTFLVPFREVGMNWLAVPAPLHIAALSAIFLDVSVNILIGAKLDGDNQWMTLSVKIISGVLMSGAFAVYVKLKLTTAATAAELSKDNAKQI